MLYHRTYTDNTLKEIDDGIVDVKITDKSITITGITPKNEIEQSRLWQSDKIKMRGTLTPYEDGTFTLYHQAMGIPFTYKPCKEKEPTQK